MSLILMIITVTLFNVGVFRMIIFHLLDDFILTFSFHQNTKSSTNHRAPGLCTNTSSMCFQCIKKKSLHSVFKYPEFKFWI